MIDSIEKYRLFDLLLLTILAVLAEVVGQVLHIKLPGAGYHISFAILIAIVALIRWGVWGSVVYVIAGLSMLVFSEGNLVESILLYPFSYVFIALSSLFFRFTDRDALKDNTFLLLVFVIFVHFSVSIGKGLAMYILTGDFIRGIAFYNITQLFSMVIVSVVMLVIRSKKGLLVDMRKYLIEINS